MFLNSAPAAYGKLGRFYATYITHRACDSPPCKVGPCIRRNLRVMQANFLSAVLNDRLCRHCLQMGVHHQS